MAPFTPSPQMTSMSKVTFEATPMTIGTGWCVRVSFPDGTARPLGGLTAEEDAGNGSNEKRAAWLKQHEGGRYFQSYGPTGGQ